MHLAVGLMILCKRTEIFQDNTQCMVTVIRREGLVLHQQARTFASAGAH